MKTYITIILSFSFFYGSAQQEKTKFIKDKSFVKEIKIAERFIDSLRLKQDIPGISVCVGNRDKIIWAEAFGYADLENKTEVSIQSRFRIGSVSKLLTSLAVGKLYQQGKLALDSPIQKYLPDFPEKKYAITSRQLAGHTAGIRHYRFTDPLPVPRRYKNVKEGLSIFSKDSLLFKPGTGYNYSTYGYSLLSAVLEGASNRDFISYMRDSIFLPFGMANTCADYSDSIVPLRVRFYEHSKGNLINAPLVDNSYKWAGGGFLSAPVDLVNMIRQLLNYTVLNKNTVELLFTPQKLEDGTSTEVGIGWRIGKNKRGMTYIHHGGMIDGGRTFVFFYPGTGYIFAITANTSGAKLNIDEAATILDYFVNKIEKK